MVRFSMAVLTALFLFSTYAYSAVGDVTGVTGNTNGKYEAWKSPSSGKGYRSWDDLVAQYPYSGGGTVLFDGRIRYYTADGWGVDYWKYNGTITYEESFVVDQTAIDSYQAKINASQTTYDIKDTEFDEFGNLVDIGHADFTNSLNDIAQANSNVNKIQSNLDYVQDKFVELVDDPFISSQLDNINDLSNTALTTLNDAVIDLGSLESLNATAQTNLDNYANQLTYAWDNLDLTKANIDAMANDVESQSEFDLQVSDFDKNNDNLSENINSINDSQNIIAAYVPQKKEKTDSIKEKTDSIKSASSGSSSVVNNVNNYINNGSTCSGSTCVANPEPTDDTEIDIKLPTAGDGLKFGDILKDSDIESKIATSKQDLKDMFTQFEGLFSSDNLTVSDSGYQANVQNIRGASVDLGAKQLESLFSDYGIKYVIWFVVVLSGIFIISGARS